MRHANEIRISCFLSDDMKFFITSYSGEFVMKCVYVTEQRHLRCSIWKKVEGKLKGKYLRCEAFSPLDRAWKVALPEFAPIIERIFDQLMVDHAFEKEFLLDDKKS